MQQRTKARGGNEQQQNSIVRPGRALRFIPAPTSPWLVRKYLFTRQQKYVTSQINKDTNSYYHNQYVFISLAITKAMLLQVQFHFILLFFK
jgi:hypothetical protein